jgi:hypothetical protein
MNKYLLFCLFVLFSGGCKNSTHDNASSVCNGNTKLAHQFIDAFYSFHHDSLKTLLAKAETSQPNILYYQQWAECGHYQVVDRSKYFVKNDSVVVFPVTVKDDLMKALQIDFHVTDTFHIVVREGAIRSVTNSSNDPDEYYAAKEWVIQNHSKEYKKACEGIWNGGPTPCACIQTILNGLEEYRAAKQKLPQ